MYKDFKSMVTNYSLGKSHLFYGRTTREKYFFLKLKKVPKKRMTTKLKGEGGALGLRGRTTKEITFVAASLIYSNQW